MFQFPENAVDDASTDQRAKISAIYVLLLAINGAAWAWAVIALADRPTLLGTAFLAYVLRPAACGRCRSHRGHRQCRAQADAGGQAAGLRSACSSRSAIRSPSCSPSLAIAADGFALQGRFHAFKSVGSIVGTGASAFFLLAIAVSTSSILRGVWRSFRRARRGEPVADEDLDLLLAGRGLLARLFRPLFRMVTRSWQMFPVGFLFGLGFDTATEISLFGVAASQASRRHVLWQIMIFPALFTAGMALVDTTDSVLMVGAYGWAFVNPLRKIWYNLTITAVSVVVALLIGGIEALGLIADKLRPRGRVLGRGRRSQRGPRQFRLSRRRHFRRELGDLVFDLSLAAARSAAGRAVLGGRRWQPP